MVTVTPTCIKKRVIRKRVISIDKNGVIDGARILIYTEAYTIISQGASTYIKMLPDETGSQSSKKTTTFPVFLGKNGVWMLLKY